MLEETLNPAQSINFRMVPLLTPYDPPPCGSICPKLREWPYLRNGCSDTLHVWFSGRVFRVANRMALFSVTSNPSWRQVGGMPPSWIISNGHISATAHLIHLISAHCAVIFAIAQLSCYTYNSKHITSIFTCPRSLREEK